MVVRIVHAKDGVYDCYNAESGAWLITRNSPDNIFSELSKMDVSGILFEERVTQMLKGKFIKDALLPDLFSKKLVEFRQGDEAELREIRFIREKNCYIVYSNEACLTLNKELLEKYTDIRV